MHSVIHVTPLNNINNPWKIELECLKPVAVCSWARTLISFPCWCKHIPWGEGDAIECTYLPTFKTNSLSLQMGRVRGIRIRHIVTVVCSLDSVGGGFKKLVEPVVRSAFSHRIESTKAQSRSKYAPSIDLLGRQAMRRSFLGNTPT
jgi:hypothetical protein